MCFYICLDVYVTKPKCCNIKSPNVRALFHGIATLVHIAILGISSILIYFGVNGCQDYLLIVPHAISLTFLIMVLLCSITGFGCSKFLGDEEENIELIGEDVDEVEVIASSGSCSAMRTYAIEILMIIHGIILAITVAEGAAPVSSR